MTFDWIREHPARWDADKARIIGGAPPGAFDFGDTEDGSPLPGEWWRVDDGGTAAGYGWIDNVGGDAEMLVAVDPARQGRGVGTFVLDRLEREVAQRGVNYLYNVVPPNHPERGAITAWLQARSFEPSSDGVLRRRVTASSAAAKAGPAKAGAAPPTTAGPAAPADATAQQAPPITFERHPDRYRHWRLDVDAPLATLTLQVDPDGGLRDGYDLKLNSYDLGVDIELADAAQRLRFEHPEVRAVVVTGGLDKVFCAGANIGMLAASTHDHKVNFCKFTNETRNGIEDSTEGSRQAWLAAVNGTAAGGGYELALACDEIILIDDRSSAVSLPEVPLLAVLPGTGGLTRVVDKRHVRRDRADVFATRTEGIRGKQAVDWGLVDAIAPRSRFDEEVRNRALARAATSDRPADASGIELTPLERVVDGDTLRYPHVDVRIDRELGAASITLHAPTESLPTTPDAIVAAGSAFWPLAACRALDDAVLHLRFNETEVGTWVFGSRGDAAAVLAADEVLAEHRENWLVREILLYWRRTLSRIDVSARTLVTLVEPGSCFAGTLAEVVLAADRSYMLDGTFEQGDHGSDESAAELTLTEINDGRYAMANGLSRLASRFYGDDDALEAVRSNLDKHLLAAEADELGLVTFTPDDIDWDDEIRMFLEERASFSPDALTGMEASYRFVGPETMHSKIFGRLTAWQNWIFQRPNAAGPEGALRRYGTGSRPVYDRKRV